MVQAREVVKGLGLVTSYAEVKGGTGNLSVMLSNTNNHPVHLEQKRYLCRGMENQFIFLSWSPWQLNLNP